jgi:hypothetical protein
MHRFIDVRIFFETLERILTRAEVLVSQLLERGPVVVDVPAQNRGESSATIAQLPHTDSLSSTPAARLTRSRGRCRPAWTRRAW